MSMLPYVPARTFVFRLAQGSDLLEAITRFANEHGVAVARVGAIGAVTEGAFAYFNQATRAYERQEVPAPLEIVSLSGTISTLKHRAFAHLHIVLADREGRCVGGHCVQGNVVFACEVTIEELAGGTLVRDFDPATGLTLWKGAVWPEEPAA